MATVGWNHLLEGRLPCLRWPVGSSISCVHIRFLAWDSPRLNQRSEEFRTGGSQATSEGSKGGWVLEVETIRILGEGTKWVPIQLGVRHRHEHKSIGIADPALINRGGDARNLSALELPRSSALGFLSNSATKLCGEATAGVRERSREWIHWGMWALTAQHRTLRRAGEYWYR